MNGEINADQVIDILIADIANMKKESAIMHVRYKELEAAHYTLAKGYKEVEAKLQSAEARLQKHAKKNKDKVEVIEHDENSSN